MRRTLFGMVLYSTFYKSPICLAGCGIWLFFGRVIFGIWAEKKGWEVGISVASGSGISCFYMVGMRDWPGKQSGISIPARVTSWPTQNRKPAKMNPLCVYIAACVWFQWIAGPGNGSVSCQVLSSVSIVAYPSLVSDPMRSLIFFCWPLT